MRLIKILPDRIQIRTDEFEFADIRLNDLMAISDGTVELVTTVSGMTSNDALEPIDDEDYITPNKSIKIIDCSILGSIKDGKFSNAVDVYPTTDITAAMLNAGQFADMLNVEEGQSFQLGTYANYGCPAMVNGNKFFQRHSCIVGNTGCGKSETVTKIMEETARATKCNMVVFDIHGEYSRLSYVDNIRIGKGFPFPIWVLGFQNMCSNILKVKEDSTVTMSALRKAYYSQCDGNEAKPHYFSFRRMLGCLQELNAEQVPTGEFYKTGDKAGMPKTTKGDYNGKLSGVINSMMTLLCEKRYSFLFEETKANYIYTLINRIMGGDNKPIKNIDLSNVPHDVAIIIIGVITQLIYNVQLQQKNDEIKPITLVCDEAHVYIPVDFQLSASQRRIVDIFENISKEGRKFGITLLAASQRPSELNKTIMAQCANFIVMKLNNENDKSMIKGMMTQGGGPAVDSTTMFSPGDCLVVGDAVPIPLKIHVNLADERPQSRTIGFWDEWKNGVNGMDYEQYLEEYLSN